ncbi:uncharacterized protein BP5553_05370 [Venustampulla echinocandica]|uniref:GPI anchored protein n=1 Tax=Venustampulla echinocandica TaxID=2656787 RepID=A0A370TQZ3_9HELO|nr:uncharacterized protein BP5553_05370 [Venustampulla echinocandica]RDL37937.1 hypothetical protein BP5553_05370 [Venustampulla echinocandica]
MRFSFTLSLLCVGLASAAGRRSLVEDQSPAPRGFLAARVLSDDKTCAETWGKGSIICTSYNCFNPTLGEQCCGGGYNCVGANNSCCGTLGPGVTGTAGVPAKSTLSQPLLPTLTRIAPSGSSSTSSSCAGVSGEECCQRLSTSQHWCSGSYPKFLCYDPASQSCCSDGSRCLTDNCCSFVNATAITPNATQATARASGSVTSSPTTAQTDATRSTNPAAATTSASAGSDNAAIRNTVGGIAVAALCSLAMALL